MANSHLKCCMCKEYKERSKIIRRANKNFCSEKCFDKWIQEQAEKGLNKARAQLKRKRNAVAQEEKRKRSEERRELKRRKDEIKPTGKLIAEAQAQVNRYIRMRDYWKPCPTCGKPAELIRQEQGWKVGGAFDAGHFRSRGAAGQLRFNILNIFHQCKSCNAGERKNSGKHETVAAAFKAHMIKWVGEEYTEYLENDNSLENKDRERLIRIKKVFSKRANWYTKRRRSEGADI